MVLGHRDLHSLDHAPQKGAAWGNYCCCMAECANERLYIPLSGDSFLQPLKHHSSSVGQLFGRETKFHPDVCGARYSCKWHYAYVSLVPNKFWKGQTRRKYVSDKGLTMCLYSGLCPS